MTAHHTLADRLRARARQLDIPPAHLAEKAGVNRSFVYDILRGRSAHPSREKLATLADLLNVDLDWLLHGIGEVEGPRPSWRAPTRPSSRSPMPARGRPWAAARWSRRTHSQPDATTTSGARGSDNVLEGEPIAAAHHARRAGDSMHPTLQDGDTVLVDHGATRPGAARHLRAA
jgi:transcriptional regulator with XRE-family HTH domain